MTPQNNTLEDLRFWKLIIFLPAGNHSVDKEMYGPVYGPVYLVIFLTIFPQLVLIWKEWKIANATKTNIQVSCKKFMP